LDAVEIAFRDPVQPPGNPIELGSQPIGAATAQGVQPTPGCRGSPADGAYGNRANKERASLAAWMAVPHLLRSTGDDPLSFPFFYGLLEPSRKT
jgi:hypothetical protein